MRPSGVGGEKLAQVGPFLLPKLACLIEDALQDTFDFLQRAVIDAGDDLQRGMTMMDAKQFAERLPGITRQVDHSAGRRRAGGARWIARIGRFWLNRKISLLRTEKICPEMPAALSEPR